MTSENIKNYMFLKRYDMTGHHRCHVVGRTKSIYFYAHENHHVNFVTKPLGQPKLQLYN